MESLKISIFWLLMLKTFLTALEGLLFLHFLPIKIQNDTKQILHKINFIVKFFNRYTTSKLNHLALFLVKCECGSNLIPENHHFISGVITDSENNPVGN